MNKLIQEFGFGIIPKHIMKNKDISLQAKGIYAYLCSYAGNKDTAFPSVKLITYELGISKDTFYKYLNELKESGYIEIMKERDGGKFARNIYKLLPCPKSSDTVLSDTVSSDTTSSDTNINSTNKNSTKSNSIRDIYNFWNTQNIIKHRKLNSKMRNKINSTLKEYTSGEIKQSIKNYAEILNDKKYWFSYRWTIDEFLHRGLEKFMDSEIAKQNYINRDYKEQKVEGKSIYDNMETYR